MKIHNHGRTAILVGLIAVSIAIVFNEFIIGFIFSADRHVDNGIVIFFIRFIQILSFCIGILFLVFREKGFGYFRIILVNLVVALMGAVILELIFGSWFQKQPQYTDWLHGISNLSIQTDISNIYKFPINPITYSRDEYGLRGRHKKLSGLDILTMGGSTTDQRYIHEGYTWQDVMRDEFKKTGMDVDVVNAGIDGRSTLGMLKDFDLWIDTLPGLSVKYYLYYVGINDFYSYDEDFWHGLDLGDEAKINVVSLAIPILSSIQDKSAIYSLFRTLNGMVKAKNAELAYAGNRINFKSQWTWTDKPNLPNYDYASLMKKHLGVYVDRLDQLCKKAKIKGAVPIVVTQKFATYYKKDGKIVGRDKLFRYADVMINGVDQYFMMQQINSRSIEVCRRNGGICIDLANEIDLSGDDFYDPVHTSPVGSAKIGSYLVKKLVPALTIRKKSARS